MTARAPALLVLTSTAARQGCAQDGTAARGRDQDHATAHARQAARHQGRGELPPPPPPPPRDSRLNGCLCSVFVQLRKFVFQVIAWKVPIKKLNMAQRCEVLAAGLNDRCVLPALTCDRSIVMRTQAVSMPSRPCGWCDRRVEAVRQSCTTMLCETWFKQNLGSDPIKLLKALDVEINEEIAATALNAIYTHFKKPSLRVDQNGPLAWDTNFAAELAAAAADPNSDGINCELALYLRVRCQWCKEQRPALDVVIDDLLLDLSSMGDLIGYHYQQTKEGNLSEIYTCRQLLACASMADFSDEAGRRSLEVAIRGMLADTTTADSLISTALSTLKTAVTDEDAYIRMVVEVMSDLREPAAAEADDEVAVEDTWLRCLAMASFLLENTQKKLSNGELQGLEESLLLPAIQHRESQIRDRGVMALGQYCLLDKSVAGKYLILFLQALKNDMQAIQHTAMKVLFDFIFAFDLTAVVDIAPPDDHDDKEGEDLAEDAVNVQATIMEVLLPYLSHAEEDLRTTATEGVAKLMLANRIGDPKLLTRLLILFYNPTTVDDTKLRQCLSVFFEAFSHSNPHNRLCLEACLLPTLRVCAHAPKSSPLRQIKLEELGGYILHLTDSSLLNAPNQTSQAAEMAAGIHERMAVVLLNELLSVRGSLS